MFVSSTYEDLKAEREVLRKLLIRYGHFLLGMEEFEGGARLPWDKIREAIDDCEYYILLVAGRYGSQDLSDPAGLSYTEKEYNLAQQLGKEIIVFMLSDQAVAGLPADRRESLRRNKEKLAVFRGRLRNQYVKIVSSTEEFKESFWTEIPKWLTTRAPKDGGWVRAAELTALCSRLESELEETRSKLKSEHSYKNVYAYLFDRLNPYDNLFTREILKDLCDNLSRMGDVTFVLEQFIHHYVNQIIDAKTTHIRIYFAYSLTRSHLTSNWDRARAEDPVNAVYRFGISNSREGAWMAGVVVKGPSNLHNVYRTVQILGVRDSKQLSTNPGTMNQPIEGEGSVIAAPVVYGRYPIGVVGLNSPRPNEAVEPRYRQLVKELAVFFSALFYAYAHEYNRQSSKTVDEEQMALTIRRELIEVLGGGPVNCGPSPEIVAEDLVNEVPTVQRVAFRDSMHTHLLDRLPSAVPVDWLVTLFYYDRTRGRQQQFVKIQIVGFSRAAAGRTEVRGRAVTSLGSVPDPNRRAYLVDAATGEWRQVSENGLSRFELDVSAGDFLAFAVGYDASIEDLRLHTSTGLVTRDWICVEVEDLAAQGAINYFFASGAAGHGLTFHAATDFFMEGPNMRLNRVQPCGEMTDLPAELRNAAREVAALASQQVEAFAGAFLGLANALEAPSSWRVDRRLAQRHDVAYVIQFSEAAQA